MTRDESRDVWLAHAPCSWMKAHPVSGFGGERYVPHSQLEPEFAARDKRIAELKEECSRLSKLFELENLSKVAWQRKAKELEPLAKAYREIADAHLNWLECFSEPDHAALVGEREVLLDRAAEFAKKGS